MPVTQWVTSTRGALDLVDPYAEPEQVESLFPDPAPRKAKPPDIAAADLTLHVLDPDDVAARERRAEFRGVLVAPAKESALCGRALPIGGLWCRATAVLEHMVEHAGCECWRLCPDCVVRAGYPHSPNGGGTRATRRAEVG